MEKLNYAFFVDFDGTIATIDVCEALVLAFSREGWQELNEKWERKELSTLECARKTFKLFKSGNPEDFLSILDEVAIDPYFRDFATYCRERGYPLTILSDGYDCCIYQLLQREGLKLPYYANKLLFTPQLDIETPYSSQSCDLCGVCKLDLMEQLKKQNQKTVYIGDGYSDFCPAQKADVVFAKTKLYKHCQKVGKQAILFKNFRDILLDFEKLSGEGIK